MNLKRAKAIRKVLNAELAKYGLTVRAAIHETVTVPSNRYSITVMEDGKEKVLKRTSLQVRLQRNSPRQVYQEMKRHVQASRGA